MPIIKSAKKRVRVARKATIRNAKTKRNLRQAVKALHASLSSKSKDAADAHRKAQSELDKAGKKNIMHKNKVARKQRQLAAAAKAAGVKPATGAKKAATKKTAPAKKAAPVKKPATKKAPAKTAKKPAKK